MLIWGSLKLPLSLRGGGVGWWVCTVIFVSNPTAVLRLCYRLCCVVVGIVTTVISKGGFYLNFCPALTKLALDPHVNFCQSFWSFFRGLWLGDLLASGSGSDILLIQDIEPSNARARLSHDTLRFFSLAEQCHTKKFYPRCFNWDFDAVKSKFVLLIE